MRCFLLIYTPPSKNIYIYRYIYIYMYCVLIKVFLSLCVYCMCVCAFAGKKKQVKSELDTCELQIIALKQQDTQNKNMLQVVQTDCDEMQLKLDDQHSALEMLRMDKVSILNKILPLLFFPPRALFLLPCTFSPFYTSLFFFFGCSVFFFVIQFFLFNSKNLCHTCIC